MTAPPRPQRIFMASDSSARCDRALARAALLARAWQARLTVAHVVHAAEADAHERPTSGAPWPRRPERWARALARALPRPKPMPGVAPGMAMDARTDRLQPGNTVDTLVRRSRVPGSNLTSASAANDSWRGAAA